MIKFQVGALKCCSLALTTLGVALATARRLVGPQ